MSLPATMVLSTNCIVFSVMQYFIKLDMDAYDYEILQSILNGNNYDLTHNDHAALETIMTSLITPLTQDSTTDSDW